MRETQTCKIAVVECIKEMFLQKGKARKTGALKSKKRTEKGTSGFTGNEDSCKWRLLRLQRLNESTTRVAHNLSPFFLLLK